MKHVITAIEQFCSLFEISDYSFSRTAGGHPSVIVHHRGVRATAVLPTAGDRARTAKNVCQQLRAQLGLRGINPRAKSDRVPRTTNHAGRAAREVLPHVAAAPPPRADFRDALAALLRSEAA